ncbi:MAG: hypothetical protein HY401_05380 [Elusimicrobia bacterium]|nr:hypothetical protein [Elusimicrobiota bacterium]
MRVFLPVVAAVFLVGRESFGGVAPVKLSADAVRLFETQPSVKPGSVVFRIERLALRVAKTDEGTARMAGDIEKALFKVRQTPYALAAIKYDVRRAVEELELRLLSDAVQTNNEARDILAAVRKDSAAAHAAGKLSLAVKKMSVSADKAADLAWDLRGEISALPYYDRWLSAAMEQLRDKSFSLKYEIQNLNKISQDIIQKAAHGRLPSRN